MLFTSSTFAWELNPSIIQEPEGTTIQLELTIDPDDFLVPDEAALDNCAANGITANWVVLYQLVGNSDSAVFGANPYVGD